MYKLHKIKAVIFGSVLSFASFSIQAQEADTDTLKSIKIPNRFFDDTKWRSTGAISTVNNESLYKTPSPSITNSLYGRLPGLSVQQNSGEPGFEDANLNIRGIGSYGYTGNNGYNTSVIFVDGFEVNPNYFNFLSASEVESISILKDAAALATFGMKGANGVVWVTTKRGYEGKSRISFQARTGSQSAINLNKPLDSYGYASLYNQAVSNDNGGVWTPYYSDPQLEDYRNGAATNTDWFAETLRDHAPYTDANLTFSGGDNKAKYFIGFDYANKQGLYSVKNTDTTANQSFGRYNIRANLDFTVARIFEARIDLNGRLEDRKAPNYISNYSTAPLWNLLYTYPSNIYPVFDVDANDPTVKRYSGTSIYRNNPYASINAQGWQSNRTRYLQGNFGLKERLDFITKGLYLDQTLSFNNYNLSTYSKTRTYARYLNGVNTTTDIDGNITASNLNAVDEENWRQFTASVGYDRDFGKNDFSSAINYHQSDFRGEGLFGYKVRYQNLSGRLNYAYNKRYVAEFGFSYFGSDAYAPGSRWQFYPTISGAWIISNEDFLKSSNAFLFLKLRASAGKSATLQSIGPGRYGSGGRYLYQQFYTEAGSYYTGNGAPAGHGGLIPTFIANPNVGPEESTKYNLGLDLTLFKALSFTADAYVDKRSGILTVDNTIPASQGEVTYLANVGKMTNKGLELSTAYHGKAGQVGYYLNALAAFNDNTIDYASEIPPAYSYNAVTGRRYGTQIGLVSEGFYQVEDFNADGSLKAGIPVPLFGPVQAGDIRYADLDNNSKIDETDVTAIGNGMLPKTTYAFGAGLDFKGIDFSVLFQGAAGTTTYLLNNQFLRAQNIAFVNNGNAFSIAQGAWAYYPGQGIDTRATATYPRLTTVANNNNYRPSSFWMKSADYLRLRNVELGYSFSGSMLAKLRMTKLRAFVNAVNPVTWSALLSDYNVDPEFTNGYPPLKSYNIGVSATF